MDWIAERVHAGMTAVDVGACHGLFTKPLAAAVGPTGTLIVVEPQRALCDELRALVPSARVIQAAMTDRPSPVVLHHSRQAEHASVYRPNVLEDIDEAEWVEAIALDSLGPLDVVKIDAQGAEAAILRSAPQTLARRQAVFYLELWKVGLEQAGDSVATVRRLFEAHGYQPHQRTWAAICDEVQGHTGHGSLDVLVLPA